MLANQALELGQAAVLELGGFRIVARALDALDLETHLLQFFFERPDLLNRLFLLLPLRRQAGPGLLEVGQLALEARQPLGRRLVRLLAQRFALDLELHDAPLDLVELGGHRVDLHPQSRRRLVDEVDGLVGQEAVGDVAMGQHRRGHQRGVLDLHAVVDLVALAQPAQDADRVLDGRLADEHRLEPPLERGVLFDVLPILVERRRPNRVQLAARQHRLEQVGGIDRSLRRAGADDGVQLVDEEDDAAFGVGDFLEDGLEPLFELAAILRAGDERAHVEGHNLLVAKALGNVAADDPLRQSFDDRRLADAGLADQHRIVLRAPREHLDDAADLLVSSDDRIELALARDLGEVPAVALERLVLALGILIGHALRAANGGEGLRTACPW